MYPENTIKKIDYKRNVMANMKWTNEWAKDITEKNYEYLFVARV
jgi:adenine-specific DNA-methyltransferase